ncbi:MAG: hypothetical protein NVSMB6_00270 [Burkholderiaceae bacterium]
MTDWTIEAVAERLTDANQIARRLPPVRVQGYYNVWPVFVRTEYERMAGDDPPPRRFPPDPKAVDRMLEAMAWMQWLEQEQRHLVWMRAQRYSWSDIAKRNACSVSTAQRRWQSALSVLCKRLNQPREIAGSG